MRPQVNEQTGSGDDRRAAERQAVNQPSTLRDRWSNACDVYVRDLSATGVSVTTDAELTIGSEVTIGLPGHGRADARVVRRVPGGYGCEFHQPLPAAALAHTFRDGTVVRLTSIDRIVEPLAQDDGAGDRWPGVVRLGVIVGGSGLLWALVLRMVAGLI